MGGDHQTKTGSPSTPLDQPSTASGPAWTLLAAVLNRLGSSRPTTHDAGISPPAPPPKESADDETTINDLPPELLSLIVNWIRRADDRASASVVAKAWLKAYHESTVPPYRLGPLVVHGGPVTCAVFHPRGTSLLTGSLDQTASMWDASGPDPLALSSQQNPCLRTFRGHSDAVMGVCFSPDAAVVGTASRDGHAMIFSSATGAWLHTCSAGHDGLPVWSIAIAPGNAVAVTGGMDCCVRLWGIGFGPAAQPLFRLSGFTHAVWAVQITAASREDGAAAIRIQAGACNRELRTWEIALSPPDIMSRQSVIEVATIGRPKAGGSTAPARNAISPDGWMALRATGCGNGARLEVRETDSDTDLSEEDGSPLRLRMPPATPAQAAERRVIYVAASAGGVGAASTTAAGGSGSDDEADYGHSDGGGSELDF